MKASIVIIAILAIGLIVLGGCATQSTAGAVTSGPPVPTSGGGCGVAAPADVAELADTADASSAL